MRTGARTTAGPGTYALLGGGMAVFGSGRPVSKVVTRAFPVFLASGLRMALAVAVPVPLLATRRRADREPGGVLPALDRRDWPVLGGIAVGGTSLWLGTLLVFGAVCGEAAYTLLGKRLTADLSPLAVATLAGLLAGIAAITRSHAEG